MKVKFGNLDLFETISFLTLDNGKTNVLLGEGTESINIIFNFKVDKEIKADKIQYKMINDKTLEISLTNWDNPLGTTLLEPLQIGVLKERKLYLIFFIKKAGSQGNIREMVFSAYLGEVVDGKN